MPRRAGGPARLGIITPSSNTNVEPTTYAMLAGIPTVTAHFDRFPLPRDLDATIDVGVLGPSAALLAEAGVDALVFHGTAGSWTGIERDRRLCADLQAATGIPATTATLATVDAVRALAPRRLGLVFPGPERIARGVAAEYAGQGLEIAATTTREELLANPQIGAMTEAEVGALVEEGCGAGVDVVVVLGTNLRAAPLVAAIEARQGATIVDSTAATLLRSLEMVGVAERPAGWGRIFAGAAPAA